MEDERDDLIRRLNRLKPVELEIIEEEVLDKDLDFFQELDMDEFFRKQDQEIFEKQEQREFDDFFKEQEYQILMEQIKPKSRSRKKGNK